MIVRCVRAADVEWSYDIPQRRTLGLILSSLCVLRSTRCHRACCVGPVGVTSAARRSAVSVPKGRVPSGPGAMWLRPRAGDR